MLLALNHMHSKKILHRDVKTLNVFLTSTNPSTVDVKLGDVGVARVRLVSVRARCIHTHTRTHTFGRLSPKTYKDEQLTPLPQILSTQSMAKTIVGTPYYLVGTEEGAVLHSSNKAHHLAIAAFFVVARALRGQAIQCQVRRLGTRGGAVRVLHSTTPI